MQWRDHTTLPSRGQRIRVRRASRVNAPEDRSGSASVIQRCQLNVRITPESGTAGVIAQPAEAEPAEAELVALAA
jgi:hypothetical protein